MPQAKSEAILLRLVNWKENSRIDTFFTDNTGKVSIIDRGGRSLKSKRGRVTAFSRMEITYFRSEKTGTGYIGEVDILESFSLEKGGSLGRLTFASAALEILNDLLPENEPLEPLYHLTVQFMRHMNNSSRESLLPVFIAYFLKTLSFLGYRPNFAGCVGCGKDKADFDGGAPALFSPERGGLVCPTCQTMGEYYIKLQSDRLDILYSLQISSLTEAAGMRITMKTTEELLELLTAFVKYQTGVDKLKTLDFLDKLKKSQLQ